MENGSNSEDSLKLTILVIDDEEPICDYLRFILESKNYTVFTAENGKRALELFEQARFDMIITDLIMPEKEGIETIIQIRKKYQDLKIIAMTGSEKGTSYLQIAMNLGANDVLFKPFTREQVYSVIQKLTRK